MVYYHYTKKDNLLDILSTKKLENNGFGVYACNSIEDLFQFINLYINTKQIQKEDTIVIKFESNAKFEESFDHNPALLNGAKAFVCYDTVKIKDIQWSKLN